MLDPMLDALQIVLQPRILLMVVGGCVIGTLIGMLPLSLIHI